MSRRTERVGSIIQQELMTIIMRELSDPRLTGMPSITRVRVSEDMSVADVYMTIMGTAGQQNTTMNALKHSAGMMRTRLTKSLSMRTVPFLKFHVDENLRKELEVLQLIGRVNQEKDEMEARAAAEAERIAAVEAARVARGDHPGDEAPEGQFDPERASAESGEETGQGKPPTGDGGA